MIVAFCLGINLTLLALVTISLAEKCKEMKGDKKDD